jgi:predicted AAA+ superfamily ATPase
LSKSNTELVSFSLFCQKTNNLIIELIREKYLEILERKMNNGIAKAILGIRRCEKSTLMMQFINKHFGSINNEEIFYIDLENYDLCEFLDLDYCYEKISEKLYSSTK